MRDQRSNFAIVVKAMRQERGLYQTDLAALAGVPQPFVSRLERGEQDLTVLANALRLIRALEIPDELLDRVLGLSSPDVLLVADDADEPDEAYPATVERLRPRVRRDAVVAAHR
jgi:transcriptional regulator with XRE-family HTH domain